MKEVKRKGRGLLSENGGAEAEISRGGGVGATTQTPAAWWALFFSSPGKLQKEEAQL